MAKIRITEEELIQMINEEYFKKITEIKLKNRLKKINEEIQQITEENIDEVEAGGKSAVRSTAWTGEKGGDKKWAPKFQKKGSHLVEDSEVEDEVVIDDNMPSDELPGEGLPGEELPGEEALEGDLDIEAILAKLADAIEDKIETVVDEKMGGETSEEVPSEEVPSEEIPSEEVPSEEMDEKKTPCAEGCPEEEGIVKEQDGTSVAQEQTPKEAVPFDNGKADIPKTDQLVSEGTKKRMQILSGIRKNDFND